MGICWLRFVAIRMLAVCVEHDAHLDSKDLPRSGVRRMAVDDHPASIDHHSVYPDRRRRGIGLSRSIRDRRRIKYDQIRSEPGSESASV